MTISKMKLEDAKQATAVAAYVEQLIAAEQHWIMSRLSWLFVSQSFCITAYALLVSASTKDIVSIQQVMILKVGLPALGIIACIFVGFAVNAARAVASALADERARLTEWINATCGTQIPLIGMSDGLRAEQLAWTRQHGNLPFFLPWAAALLWVALLVRVDFGM